MIKKLEIKNELKELAGKFIGYEMLGKFAFKKGRLLEHERYSWMGKKLKFEFSKKRNTLKMITNEAGLYDEMSANFLNLNNDIDVLNENQ